MKQQYIIDMEDHNSVIIEIALTEFMGKVFDASAVSNCLGHGLEITKVLKIR